MGIMQKKTAVLELFKKIYKIRRVENKIASLYPEQEMRCPVHLSIGQEAVAAGVCQSLSKKDKIISSHRCHAHYLAKGGNLNKMIAEIYGKKTGCADGLGGSMHLQDLKAGVVMSIPIVGSPIPIGAGIALQSLNEKKKQLILHPWQICLFYLFVKIIIILFTLPSKIDSQKIEKLPK